MIFVEVVRTRIRKSMYRLLGQRIYVQVAKTRKLISLGKSDPCTGCYNKKIYVQTARTRRSMYWLLGQKNLCTGCHDKKNYVQVTKIN